MEIIDLNRDNLYKEHICCAINSKTTEIGVKAKRDWLACRMQEGLRFKRLDARGKVFIEYIPSKSAWLPIDAVGYIIINCFWVSGSYKGHGYGKKLLELCEEDARNQGFKGVALIVGDKKRPFLSDKKFMQHHGYEVCDECLSFFELMVKKFDKRNESPRFKICAKEGIGKNIQGIDIFYTSQCPFTTPYVKLLEPIIHMYDYPIRVQEIKTKEAAQNHFCPTTTYSVFIDGQFYTNEILTPDKLHKLIERLLNK